MGNVFPAYPVAIDVIDPLTGAFVPGLSTINQEDGTYELTGIPEGDYKVLFNAFGESKDLLDELSGNTLCDDGDCDRVELGNVVHISNGTTTLNVTLTSGAMVRGKVTDSANKPLQGVTVEFYNRYGEPYCCKRLSDEKGQWERPVGIFQPYYALARFAEPSSYQAFAYKNHPCSGCDVLTTGTEIFVEYGRSGIDFKLPRVEADPEIERATVDEQKYSGSWFDPERDGEGFIVEVLDQAGPGGEGQAVVVFWFTYTPDGEQAWMVGSGAISAGVAEVEFEITAGASFGASFDPGQVNRKTWGSLRLDFLNCTHAQAEYGGDFGSGQLQLTRLTAINGLGCTDADGVVVSGNSGSSGAWFNQSRDGEGLIIEVVDESRVLAYWFTYDTDGRQMWMLGVGDLDGQQQTSIPMQRTHGGRFGDALEPENVTFEDWGEVNFGFNECNHASFSWAAQTPYSSGGFDLARLTALKNISCSMP